MQNNENPFSDKKTMFAILFVGVFFVGWNFYLSKRYPPAPKPAVTADAAATEAAKNVQNPAAAVNTTVAQADAKSAPVGPVPEKTFSFENDKVRFVLSSRGMGVKQWVVKNYLGADQTPIVLGVSDDVSLFEMRWIGGAPLDFQIEEQGAGAFVGTARAGSATIRREFKFNADDGSIENSIKITGAGPEISKGFSIAMPEKTHQAKTSFLFPSYDHQDFFVAHNGTTDTVNFNRAKEDINQELKTANLVSVGSQYFTTAFLDRSDILPDAKLKASVAGGHAVAELEYKPVQAAPEMNFKQVLYAGPKSIDTLQKIDPEMARLIDFGFFSVIGKPLLYIMKWFHGVVGNWGWAIILLTLLVRFCVMPFNLMSVRSMKAMQRIQPQMTALRERHKEDPLALNREMMALMKENKANPLGGCLPMLLQIPVFFALFRVIGSSVELYQSPFGLWITDLSVHDRFYVLPVLMGVTMFLQQKMTPTNMDPTQAKIMQFLPILFAGFMLQLPAGLTLYMVVSSVFGIIQQWFFMRDRNQPALAK